MPSIDSLGYAAPETNAQPPAPANEVSPLPAWPGMTEPAEPGAPAEPSGWVEGEPAAAQEELMADALGDGGRLVEVEVLDDFSGGGVERHL